MGRKEVKSFDDIKGYLVRSDLFWKNPVGFSKKVSEVVNENALSSMRTQGRCIYDFVVGEDHNHIVSNDQKIQFYSQLDGRTFRDIDYAQGCYFDSNETLAFSMLKKDDDTLVVKYSHGHKEENGIHEAVRGVEVYRGNNYYSIENKVVSKNGKIRAVSSDVKYSNDNINAVDCKTFCIEHRECNSRFALRGEVENPSNLVAFNEFVAEKSYQPTVYVEVCNGEHEVVDQTTAAGLHESYQIAFNVHDIKNLEEFKPEELQSQDSAVLDSEK